ncbi:hypothetical protein DPMN_132533 [Dreissena polymorpha]|uniref:Uncharacterized protein n=1 Tax=Dreissena polymorpha TaxID=45954 RepID=A0A9D4FWB8_DREPO|nr:hypothetical protein DPMN_132533 [Dreissena polymorpha]
MLMFISMSRCSCIFKISLSSTIAGGRNRSTCVIVFKNIIADMYAIIIDAEARQGTNEGCTTITGCSGLLV